MQAENPKATGTKGRCPLILAVGLAGAVVLDTLVQVLWKISAESLPTDLMRRLGAAPGLILARPIFLALGLLIALQMINWLKVLDEADVSYALPITALSYVTVGAVSAVWLHEALTPQRMLGIGLILFGVFLVSRTDHKSGAA